MLINVTDTQNNNDQLTYDTFEFCDGCKIQAIIELESIIIEYT